MRFIIKEAAKVSDCFYVTIWNNIHILMHAPETRSDTNTIKQKV